MQVWRKVVNGLCGLRGSEARTLGFGFLWAGGMGRGRPRRNFVYNRWGSRAAPSSLADPSTNIRALQGLLVSGRYGEVGTRNTHTRWLLARCTP